MTPVFTIEEIRPMRDGYTISRDSRLGNLTKVTHFSLGKGTSITPESYDHITMYIGASGSGDFIVGKDAVRHRLLPDSVLIVPAKELCGMETDSGIVYTVLIITNQNEKEIINYEEGSISNMDVVSTNNMKYVLMAFDEGTGLTPHRAHGNAIVFALEGKATIGYEGKDYEISEGECFKFEKNGLHSVTANVKFKMALLLVIE